MGLFSSVFPLAAVPLVSVFIGCCVDASVSPWELSLRFEVFLVAGCELSLRFLCSLADVLILRFPLGSCPFGFYFATVLRSLLLHISSLRISISIIYFTMKFSKYFFSIAVFERDEEASEIEAEKWRPALSKDAECNMLQDLIPRFDSGEIFALYLISTPKLFEDSRQSSCMQRTDTTYKTFERTSKILFIVLQLLILKLWHIRGMGGRRAHRCLAAYRAAQSQAKPTKDTYIPNIAALGNAHRAASLDEEHFHIF
ncbi:hypothetical protein M5K25_024132 [Dendrobium thyrsiflorum]|uniref:Uncharacterized protein n=1 Tax=Dendrobium thyrsiflorum TaxID=117978 RepID=A0ABD0U153_DENTH